MIKIFLSLFLVFSLSACASDTFYYEYGKKVYLKPMIQTRSAKKSDVTYYKTDTNETIGIKNEILFKLRKDISLDDFLQKFQLDKTQVKKIADKTYLLKLSKGENLFELTQQMYEDKDTIYATPNKIKKYHLR